MGPGGGGRRGNLGLGHKTRPRHQGVNEPAQARPVAEVRGGVLCMEVKLHEGRLSVCKGVVMEAQVAQHVSLAPEVAR